MSVFDQPPATETRADDLPPPLDHVPPASHRPRLRVPRRSRIRWYIALAAAGVVAVAANSVTVDGDDLGTQPEVTAAPAPATTVPATATTVPAPTVPTTPPTSAAAETTVVVPPSATATPGTAAVPDAPPPTLVDVHDVTGYMVVSIPDLLQTSVDPIEIDGVHLHQVTGAADLERYLAGDLSVFGVTVLDAPLDALGAPAQFAARFDPGNACRPTGVEGEVPTALGTATVLGYDQCGATASTLVLLAVDATSAQRSVFVGVQGGDASLAAARQLALAIAESYRVS